VFVAGFFWLGGAWTAEAGFSAAGAEVGSTSSECVWTLMVSSRDRRGHVDLAEGWGYGGDGDEIY